MRQPRYQRKTPPWMPQPYHELERLAFLEGWLLQEDVRLARKGQRPNSRLRKAARRAKLDRRHLLEQLRAEAVEQRRRQPELDRVAAWYRGVMKQWNRSAEARELRANDRLAKRHGF